MNSQRPKLNNSKAKLRNGLPLSVIDFKSVILPKNGCDLKKTMDSIQARLIAQAIVMSENKTEAAKLLGVNRTTLIEKMNRMKSA